MLAGAEIGHCLPAGIPMSLPSSAFQLLLETCPGLCSTAAFQTRAGPGPVPPSTLTATQATV